MTSLQGKRGQKRVLDEDEYVDKLEQVIESNYFPHLNTMKNQLEYLQQNELFSLQTLRESYADIFGDDINIAMNDEKKLSISEFFREFVSEDNASFSELLKKQQEEQRRKMHWAYEQNQNQKAGMLMLYYVGNKKLTVEERNTVDAILNGDEDNQLVGDDRKNGVTHWAFRVRNQFFFPPLLEDSQDTSKIPQQANNNILPITNNSQQLLIKDIQQDNFAVPSLPKRAEKVIQKDVVYSSGSALVKHVDNFLRNNTIRQRDMTPLEPPHTPTTVQSLDSWEEEVLPTNQRLGRTVAMSPSPMPGKGVLQSPLMTWGEVAATPMILQRNNDNEKIKKKKKDDLSSDKRIDVNNTSLKSNTEGDNSQHDVHFRFLSNNMLAEDRARQLLDSKKSNKSRSSDNLSLRSNTTQSMKSAVTGTMSTQYKKLQNLTPAAQKLAQKVLKKL